MDRPPPKAALFDVGNVIVRWDARTLYSKIFADPAERDRFLAEVCNMAWHTEHDRGRLFADNIAELQALHPRYAAEIAAWRERWWEMFSGAIAETEDVMRDLHARGVKIYGLTNMSSEIWPGVQAMSEVFGLFDAVIVSAEERLVKPDPALYQRVLDRTGLASSDLLFVDDNPDNIAAAEALGFHTHLFADPAALRPAMERAGLL